MAKKRTKIPKFADGGNVTYYTASERAAAGVPDRPNYRMGTVSADSDAPNTYMGNVKERIRSLITPKIASTIANRNQAMQSAIDNADGTAPGKKKGGQIKSKPRGVGVARKGHGKAMK